MAIQTFKASARLKDNVLVETEARGHKLTIDEPKNLGGSDKGMSPVEVVLAGLGACQSIVARIYAEQFKINLEEFSVDVEGDLDLDGFLGKSDVRPGFSKIRYTYTIQTDASEESVKAFIEHVEKNCPVGDSLANAVELLPGEIVITNPVK